MSQDEQKGSQWLSHLLKKPDGSQKKRKLPLHYIALIGCLGIALMIAGNLLTNQPMNEEQSLPVFNDKESEEDAEVFGRNASPEPYSMEDYEMRYENQLRDTLEQIVGLSDVSVMINLAESERNVYEKNINAREQHTDETDREGGTRKVDDTTRDEQLVIVRSGDREEPVLVSKEKPSIRGVLVVAEGVENAQVKLWVIEAVSRVLDVPSHRISVMPKKMEEE
ncbi:mutants block sporulation after engulfment [Alkalihalophilus pseudofirmus OF4]|uniref:Mutants block sporulation after engulfment n=1 Tax=Alkalihalophilus pseudofirmus (strain ATCC BAA-2126 / JCM 17055 / OF4) TaxID=398511 RepID=D3FUV4_ALKPO|nr:MULTISPECIES: stage III sporulation protein AG [Alkalihalophilus]ADC48380.1 mutants block sporulation after engulfment [Alkalihalophilus pseudofirmus OF4]MED1601123.1 stage III sporulation protein AG [Alkalihalophilus marmarensis]